MSDWQDISTAPKDGTLIRLRRVTPSGFEFVGTGLFGVLHGSAPAQTAMAPDPLDRFSPDYYASEAALLAQWAAGAKWLKEDRMHAFPAPTHWMALPIMDDLDDEIELVIDGPWDDDEIPF